MPKENLGAQARKSERVLLRIPIRVEGKDTLGKAFDETTHTLVVNRSGGLIIVPQLLQPGAIIKITNLTNKISCPFEVVMRPAKSLSGTPEWGVKCLEPDADIWGVHFPTKSEGQSQGPLIHVLLACQECFSREMATLTVQEYRDLMAESCLPRPCPKCSATKNWKFAFIEVGYQEVLPSLPGSAAAESAAQGEAEKRPDRRRAVKLPLGIRLPDGGEEPSTTENISDSILCFASNLEMQVGEKVYVKVGLDNPEEQCDIPARIMWRRPASEIGRALYGAKLERGD